MLIEVVEAVIIEKDAANRLLLAAKQKSIRFKLVRPSRTRSQREALRIKQENRDPQAPTTDKREE